MFDLNTSILDSEYADELDEELLEEYICELMAEFEGTVRAVLRHIGVEEAETIPVPKPVWRPLSGPERDAWAKRFREEMERS